MSSEEAENWAENFASTGDDVFVASIAKGLLLVNCDETGEHFHLFYAPANGLQNFLSLTMSTHRRDSGSAALVGIQVHIYVYPSLK